MENGERLMDNRYEKLKEIVNEMGKVLVAFSGGVDSTFCSKLQRICFPGKMCWL